MDLQSALIASTIILGTFAGASPVMAQSYSYEANTRYYVEGAIPAYTPNRGYRYGQPYGISHLPVPQQIDNEDIDEEVTHTKRTIRRIYR